MPAGKAVNQRLYIAMRLSGPAGNLRLDRRAVADAFAVDLIRKADLVCEGCLTNARDTIQWFQVGADKGDQPREAGSLYRVDIAIGNSLSHMCEVL
jgi:hypothetical protein